MRITGFAKGLFSLVDSLDMGRGLSELSDTVAGTVDLTPLLGLNRLKEDAVGNTSGPTAQPVPLFTVPTDKVWRVIAWGSTWTTGAASTVTSGGLGIRLSNLTAAGQFVAYCSDNVEMAVSSSRALAARCPLLLPPGAILCFYATQPGVGVNVSSHIVFEEFDA